MMVVLWREPCEHAVLGVLQRYSGIKCRMCELARRREFYKKNAEQKRKETREWYAKNSKRAREWRGIVFAAGQTEETVLAAQNGLCAICKKDLKVLKRKQWHVDHWHNAPSGAPNIRGALCLQCNAGIGQLRDSIELLESAIAYLSNTQLTLTDNVLSSTTTETYT